MQTKYEPWPNQVGNTTFLLKSILTLAPPPPSPRTSGHGRTTKQLATRHNCRT